MSIVFLVSDFLTDEDLFAGPDLAMLARAPRRHRGRSGRSLRARAPAGPGYMRLRDLESGAHARPSALGAIAGALCGRRAPASRSRSRARSTAFPWSMCSSRPTTPSRAAAVALRRRGQLMIASRTAHSPTRGPAVARSAMAWRIAAARRPPQRRASSAQARPPTPLLRDGARRLSRRRVDRPAIWVADRLTYTVEIVCPRRRSTSLVGDLAREKLHAHGISTSSSADTQPPRRGRRDALRVRLRPHDIRVDRRDAEQIGSFPCATTSVARRAAPGGGGARTVRSSSHAVDRRVPQPAAGRPGHLRRPRRTPMSRNAGLPCRLLQPVGLGLIILSARAGGARVLARLALRVRERRRATTSRSSRRHSSRGARRFDGVRAIDAADPPGAARGLRAAGCACPPASHRRVCGVAATGMTPAEIEAALDAVRAQRSPSSSWRPCSLRRELARYASPDL